MITTLTDALIMSIYRNDTASFGMAEPTESWRSFEFPGTMEKMSFMNDMKSFSN